MAPLMALLALVAPCKREGEPCARRTSRAARFLPCRSFFLVSVLTELLLSPGRDGLRSAVPCLVHPAVSGGSHPAQPLDSHKGTGSSSRVPQLSSAALPRLWRDLVPFWHKKEINQKVFCELTLGKGERETSPAFGTANPLL